MNRESRRNLKKQGVTDETIQKIDALNKPCTIGESVQLARAAAEDVCGEILDLYKRESSGLMMAMTIQIEMLKNLLISKGMITEESFMEEFRVKAKEFEDQQREYLESLRKKESSEEPKNVSASTGMEVSDIEVVKK